MNQEEEKYRSPEIPLDEEGYFQSFDINTCTTQQISEFYQKYGLVVFRDAISPQDV